MVEFKRSFDNLSEKIRKTKDKVSTEEATKHSYVMPFLKCLGYDVFDPTIICPEFTADIGTKKGEKVDYAIMKDGKPIVLIEVKCHDENLNNHNSQIVRYFNITDAKFAILTNGIEYRFFSDLEEKNKMDNTPFLSISLESSLKDREIKELAKFTKEELDVDTILTSANAQKNMNEIRRIFKEEIENPSEEFIRCFASKVTKKRLISSVIDEFKLYVKESLENYIMDTVKDRINKVQEKINEKEVIVTETTEVKTKEQEDSKITTTDEELDGYRIVKAILTEITPSNNVTYRDYQTHFAILFQGKARSVICKLKLDGIKKYLEVPQEEQYIEIEAVDDLYKHKDRIKNSCMVFIGEQENK